MESTQPPTRPPFARLLKRFRLAAGLSQEALAERAGLSWRTISDLERGVKHGPRGSTLRLLADALALDTEERARLQASALPPDNTRETRAPPANTVPTNLPLALTSFIGRQREIGTLRRLLGETRLLTLTGAGGCGKTRLALEVARELARDGPDGGAYPDGIWLVELAALSSDVQVSRTVAAALGVHEQSGQALRDTLATMLRVKRLLIVLDNCEHLLAACAELTDRLLQACPHVCVVATSREALNIGGERRWRVPSFDLPAPLARLTVDQTRSCDAVQLFVGRARMVVPGFSLTAENMALVTLICRRLDGIPLAIELAAARLSALSLDDLAARLDDRFRLLTGGSRTALPRQQTLRATLDWSYDLLDEQGRLLLHRLTVFAGGWTLEAAEAICAADDSAAEDLFDVLTALIDKSLVIHDVGESGSRYWLLETVRQYGHERLQAAGDPARLRNSHLDWYQALAERARLNMGGSERAIWLRRLEAELENVRTALLWSATREGGSEIGLRLAVALEDFWYLRGYASEARQWLEELLARGGATSTALRARALDVLALLTHYQGDERQALALYERAYDLHISAGDAPSAMWSLTHQALILIYLDDCAKAIPLLELALPAHRENGDYHGVAWSLNYMAQVRQLGGDLTQAGALYAESLAIFQDLGDKFGISDQYAHLANIARERQDYAQARTLLRQGVEVLRVLSDKPGFAKCFEALALVAAAQGQPLRATRLTSATHCLRQAIGTPREIVDRAPIQRMLRETRAALGDDVFAAAWAAGQALGFEETLTEALELDQAP